MPRYKAVLRGDRAVVLDGRDNLYRQGFGDWRGSELVLDPLEVSYLIWSGRIDVVDDSGREISFLETLETLISLPNGFLRFLVYKDLRRKGRVVVSEEKTGLLRLYPKGAKVGEAAAKELVLPLSEDRVVRHKDILDKVEMAGRLRKTLVLAVVDDEMNVTYYKATNFMPDRREGGHDPSELPESEGVLVGDRVLVLDEDAGILYSRGFWGHPLGIEKPEPFVVYDVPLQLSLIEAVYLAAKDKLRVKDTRGKVLSIDELREHLSRYRDRAELRERVYTYWRDLGYVPKAGSKYGVDYMIYERGPGLEHAPYLCIVGSVQEKTKPVELIRAGRIATSVRKDLIVSLVSGENVVSYKLKWFKP